MTFRLLHDLVAIQPEKAVTETESGLYLGKSVAPPLRGIIKIVGPGRHLDNGEFVPTSVLVGEKAVYAQGVGEEIEVEGEILLAIHEGHIHGVFS